MNDWGHFLSQFRFYRKFKGGDWVKVSYEISIHPFWIKNGEQPRCCGMRIIDHEYWVKD
jgi:hypothetical protein